jgi:AAA domain/Transcriptional regulator, AbiEi antitoxin
VTAYELVCRRLLEVTGQPVRNGSARCPAHDDHHPSLSVHEGDDGRALVYCHAGCDLADVLKPLDLEIRDLFPEPDGSNIDATTCDYVDETGTRLFQVVRKPGKRFLCRRPDGADGWIYKLGDTRRVLYRLVEVIAAVAAGITVWIVEGEKDADRLAAAGYVATTNPQGAGKWRADYNETLRGADVVIVADRDEPGRAHARDIAHQLDGVAATVRVLEAAEGNDVSDHLAAGHSVDELVPVDLDNTVAAETPSGLLAGLRNGAWLEAQDFPPLRYHLPGIIPEGSTLLVGPPKIGKSYFVLTVGLAAASGGWALGQHIDARPVLYLALEDGHRRLQSRCRTLLGTDRIPAAFEYLCTVQPELVVATIEAWLTRHLGAEPLVILDTLGKVMPPALFGESPYGRDYRIGSVLKRLVDEQPGAALVTNHHDRKAQSEDFVDKVSGTNGLAGAADTIVVVARARHESTGVLSVTGRDVAEGAYAVSFDGPRGLWSLKGGGLAAAAAEAAQRRQRHGAGELSGDILEMVASAGTATTKAVTDTFGDDARRYLSRLVDTGRLIRVKRGLYTVPPSYTPVPSVPLSQQALVWDKGTDGTPLQEGDDL